MLHVRQPVTDWLQSVAKLPAKALVKAVSVQWLSEAKAVNPGVITFMRYVNDPWQVVSPGDTDAIRESRARTWFNAFVDDTFLNQSTAGIPHWQATNIVGWWNEYYADSQSTAEKELWWRQERVAARIWRDEYRNGPNKAKLSHILLAIGAAPVGNFNPWQTGETAVMYDCVVDYHAYSHYLGFKQLDPGDWPYHAGRWELMDNDFRARGFNVKWVFGEAGPYHSVVDGWVSQKVLGGDQVAYVNAMRGFISRIKATAAYREGRVLGFALFTTGGGSQWSLYETNQPELNMLADMIKAEWTPVVAPPNPLPGLRLHPVFHETFVVSNGGQFNAPRSYGPHEGTDYVATSMQGTEMIHCAYAGTVDIVGNNPTGYGLYVRVRHTRNGGTFYTYYGHLDTQVVAVGQVLQAGDVVGEVGSTGNSSGPHVHLTLRVPYYGASGYVVPDVVDPDPYVARWVDPAPIPPARIRHTIHLLPQDTTKEELLALAEELHPSRSAFAYSADVVHAVDWAGTPDSKVVVVEGHRWNGDIYAWLTARGVSYVTRDFPV